MSGKYVFVSSGDVTRADLADTTDPANGAGLIGWISSFANAVATTVARWMRWQYVTPLEFMTLAQQQDVISKTGSLDVTAALQAWLNCGAKRGRLPEGKYKLTDELTQSTQMSIFGDGINAVELVQATADKGVIKTNIGGTLAYVTWDGFKATGAGRGAGTSVGVLMGDSTHGTDYCRLSNIEATNFGAANVRLVNGIRCSIGDVYAHGDPTGVLSAADIGLHLLGTFAFAGSNYDNRIGYVEAYNNVTDIKSENGGKNVFQGPYTYNQNYTGTLHHIHELNSSLNSWHRPHIEPLSLSAGATPLWLIESSAGNPYTYMLGPLIEEMEYENGTLATTCDVIQIGTAGGLTVYNTRIEDGKFMPVSAGKYHVQLTNESATRIAHSALRNNNVPFDRLVRELSVNNPNSDTNGSYVGSPFEDSYGSWTPMLYADGTSGAGGAGSLATLTGSAKWARSGKTVRVWLDTVLSAKTAKTGVVTVRGCEAISPNSGTTIFAAASAGAIPVQLIVVDLATAYPVYGYFNTATGYISFYNTTVTALLTETSFANGTEIILSFEYEVG